MAKGNGGPAFARPVGGHGEEFDAGADGMSLRDYFAAQALTGHCARIRIHDDGIWPSAADVARWAYAQADAMLAEREK